jgi:integrase
LTWRGYESAVRVHIAPRLGDILLQRLGPADIQGFYSALANTSSKAITRSQICTVLGAALARAVEQKLIATSPAEALKKRLPRLERAKPTVLDAARCEALLGHARQHHDLYPTVLLALSTGMRRSEILALKWSNVDFANGEILVDEQVEQLPGSIRFKSPKNGASRIVAVPEAVIAELRRIKLEQAERLLRLGVRQANESRVCTRADGTDYKPNHLTEAFRVFIRQTGLPVCRFHDLRHSHASQLLRLGVSVRVVADRLGHSDGGALLLRTYAHSDASMHAEAARRLGAALFGKL